MEAKGGTEKTPPKFIDFFKKNQIIVLLAGSVSIALSLTGLSLWLYVASGTQQLDLSRPGYRSVQDKVNRDPVSDLYPATGPMSLSEIEKFKKLFQKEIDKANKSDAFLGDPLSPEGLGIDIHGDSHQADFTF